MRRRSAGRRFFRNCPVVPVQETPRMKQCETLEKRSVFGLNLPISHSTKAPKCLKWRSREPALSRLHRQGCCTSVAQTWVQFGGAIGKPPKVASRQRTTSDCGYTRE